MDAVLSQPSQDRLQVLPHTQYITTEHLTPTDVAPNPLDQFRRWFKEAVEGGIVQEPEAMSLSTATPSGIPSARIVLLKQELLANPHAALVFYWREVRKSVRVVGCVEKISREESDAYIRSRPVSSQLSAWASKQSAVIEEGQLEERLKKTTKRFADGDVPPPEFWGGWRVVPKEIEFWCGKPSRLHDRVRYLRTDESTDGNPTWRIDRLSP